MNLVRTNFSKNLSKFRERKHLSQTELAKKLNLSGGTISAYEKGSTTPSLEVAARIAYILHVSLDELVGLPKAPREYKEFTDLRRLEKIEIYKSHIEHLEDYTKLLKAERQAIEDSFYEEDTDLFNTLFDKDTQIWEEYTKQKD